MSSLNSASMSASSPQTSVLDHDSSGSEFLPVWTCPAPPAPTPTSATTTVAATATTTTTTPRSKSSCQPSEAITKTTTMISSMAGSSCNGGMFNYASSASLQAEFPWYEVGINTHVHQRIPSVIFPALLHASGSNDIAAPSPLRPFSISSFLVDDGLDGGCESGDDESDTEPNASRYSLTEKEKWKAGTDDEDGGRWPRSPSPQFRFPRINNSIEDWVIHTRPILQEYADRQTPLPLGRRLEVSIDEPSEFILGSLQLLVNRDRKDCTKHSRQLGPQLIENFVNIDRWAKEYFRSRHDVTDICNDVSTLLTIVMNGFYEGLVQLIDRLVEFALEQMRFCGRSNLAVEDFSFGYDFRMSQDLPFYVETSSRIREPLPIHSVKVRHDPEPVMTHSGRQVKPTKRAQEACEQAATSEQRKKGKEKGPPQAVKGKRVPKGAVAPPRLRKSSVQPCSSDSESDRTTMETSQITPTHTLPLPPPRKTMSDHTKHRPLHPSNLGRLPPISPSLSSSEFPSENSVSASGSTPVSALGDGQNFSGCSGPDTTASCPPPCRLKIVIPRRAASKSLSGAVTSSCGPTTTTTTVMTANEANTKSIAQTSALETANESEDHAQGNHICSVSGVVGGQGLEFRPRCPSEASVGDNTEGDGERGNGMRGNGPITLTSNTGSIADDGSTGATVQNERTGTIRVGAKGEGGGGDVVFALPVEHPNLACAHGRGTGDTSHDDEHPVSGNIDTKERETLPPVPPSDPEPEPGSGSCRLRGRKRKLDECED